jgi:hypothetical protein
MQPSKYSDAFIESLKEYTASIHPKMMTQEEKDGLDRTWDDVFDDMLHGGPDMEKTAAEEEAEMNARLKRFRKC